MSSLILTNLLRDNPGVVTGMGRFLMVNAFHMWNQL